MGLILVSVNEISRTDSSAGLKTRRAATARVLELDSTRQHYGGRTRFE